MSRRTRIEALQAEFLTFLEKKKISESKKRVLALEFATRTEKAINPIVNKSPQIWIDDTYNQDKRIHITLRSPLTTNIEQVFKSYLERMGNSRPSKEYWKLIEIVNPLAIGVTYRCELRQTPLPTPTQQRAKSKKQEEKISSNIFAQFSSLPPEKQKEILAQFGGQKKK